MIEGVSDIPEGLPDDIVALYAELEQAWQKLADSVSNPDMLFLLFDDIINNPLCIAVTGALWVVLGFKIFSHIVSSLCSRS